MSASTQKKPGRPRKHPLKEGQSRQAASVRAARARWAEEGRCIRCGDIPALGRKKCHRCLDYLRDWIAARRA